MIQSAEKNAEALAFKQSFADWGAGCARTTAWVGAYNCNADDGCQWVDGSRSGGTTGIAHYPDGSFWADGGSLNGGPGICENICPEGTFKNSTWSRDPAYITAYGRSSLVATLVDVMPTTVYCASSGQSVNYDCADCPSEHCPSPGLPLGNRESGGSYWNPFPSNQPSFYIAVDLEIPTQVEAVLWASTGDTSHDASSLVLSQSADAVTWSVPVASLDLTPYVGIGSQTVVPLHSSHLPSLFRSENFARACGNDGLQPCPTTQISNYDAPRVPSKAVDGNTNTEWLAESCAATGSANNPWWSVDMERTRSVGSVKIWNRGDCCSDRLQGFEVWIGDDASSYSANLRCSTGGTAPLTSPYEVRVDCIGTGRYLFVALPGNDKMLTLCEVEVYGGLEGERYA